MKARGKSDHAPSILVLVAALNEEEGIGPTLAELRECLPCSAFLVVDGRSTDGTVNIAKNEGATVLLQRGHGKGDAIRHGVQSISEDFDYLVLTDADFTYPAAHIPNMIEMLEQNRELGMVCGNRFNSHLIIGYMRDVFYLGNKLLTLVHNMLNGVKLRDPLTGLRVIRWNIVKDWQPKSEGFDIEVELNHHVENQGYDIAEIDIAYRERVGIKKLSIKHGVSILRRIFLEIPQ